MERLNWRKSSRSNGTGGDCVEVVATPATVLVRDSKDPRGPMLSFQPTQWTAFIAAVREGEFDLP